MRTLPSQPAQIHVPRATSTGAERVLAAQHAALGALGLVLIVGAPAVVLLTCVVHNPRATGAAIPILWLAAFLCAALAFASTSSHACVEVTEGAAQRALLFAGVALVGPLTLHLLLQAHVWAPSLWIAFGQPYVCATPVDFCLETNFAAWMHASLILAGPSHLVFAPLCALRGYRSASGKRGPHLALIGGAATLPAVWCLVFWGPAAVLPAAYVACTCVPLLVIMRRLEGAGRRALTTARP